VSGFKFHLISNIIVTFCVIFRKDITALVDDIAMNTKKLIKATSREIDKWRRY
jgi:hypothetical protein